MTSNDPDLSLSLGWRLSQHARAACVARGVSVRDVLLTVVDYEQSYTCDHRGEGRQVRQRGDLAVVVDRIGQVVITVLLRQENQWTNEHVRARMQGAA